MPCNVPFSFSIPERERKDGDTSSIVPTAPFATATGVAFTARRRCRIKLIKNGDSNSYYLSKNRHESGYLLIQEFSQNALEVEYREDDLPDPQTLYIPDSQVASYDILGVKCSGSNSSSLDSAGLCPIDSSSGAGSWTGYRGGTLIKNAWKISSKPEGGAILSRVNGSTTMYASSFAVGSGLIFYPNAMLSSAASIFFEPI